MRELPDRRRIVRRLGLQGMLHDVLVNTIASSKVVSHPLRRRILRWRGLTVATSALVYPSCFFGGTRISIGPDTFVNWGCFFDNIGSITVGARCSIGMQAMICTSDHQRGDARQRAGALVGRDVVIGDGCWIGARAVILPGVSIGDGCVVGAGAVVTRDCPPNTLVAGVPASPIRSLT